MQATSGSAKGLLPSVWAVREIVSSQPRMKQTPATATPDTNSVSNPSFHEFRHLQQFNNFNQRHSLREQPEKFYHDSIKSPSTMKSEQAYSDLSSTEGHDDPLLSSDLASTSTNDDERWSRGKSWGGRPSAKASFIDIREYWWLITAGMLGVIIGLQLVIWHEIKAQSCGNMVQVGSDYNGKTPTCSQIFPLPTYSTDQDH